MTVHVKLCSQAGFSPTFPAVNSFTSPPALDTEGEVHCGYRPQLQSIEKYLAESEKTRHIYQANWSRKGDCGAAGGRGTLEESLSGFRSAASRCSFKKKKEERNRKEEDAWEENIIDSGVILVVCASK